MEALKTINYRLFFIAAFTMLTINILFIINGQSITGSNAREIHLLDLDADSLPDAYFENKVWINDSEGHFTETTTSFGRGTYPGFADLNKDGSVDAVCNDSISLNDSTFHFYFSKKLISDIVMSKPILADIDNNSDTDIISCSATADRILLNDATGNFINTNKSPGGWEQSNYAWRYQW